MSRLPSGVGISVSDDLKLSIILQAVDDTKAAVASAVASIGKVETEAKAVGERAQAALLGGFKDARSSAFDDFVKSIGASNMAPKVDLLPKGALDELNGYKSAVETLRRDFADIATKAGGAIELDSGLAKRSAEAFALSQSEVGKLKEGVDRLNKSGQDAANGVAEIGGERVLGKIRALAPAIAMAAGAAGGAAAFMWLKDAVKDVSALGQKLDDIMQKTDLTANQAAGLVNLAKQTGTDLGDLVGAVQKAGGGDQAYQTLKDINEQIAQAASMSEKLTIAEGAFDKYGKKIIGALNETRPAFKALLEDGEKLLGMPDKLAQTADQYGKEVEKLGLQATQFKIKVTGPIIEGLTQLLGKTNEYMAKHGTLLGGLTAIGYAQAKAVDKVIGTNLAGDDVGKLSKKVNELFKETAEARKELEKLVATPVGSQGSFGVVTQKGKDAGIARKKQEIAELSAELKDAIKQRDSFVKAGEDAAEGFAEGVRKGADKATAAAEDMAGKTVAATKKKLDSHSPSRVFMAIGEDIGAGLVVGIAASEEDVRKAVEGLGEAAIYAGDEATLKFIREQEQAIRELRGEMGTLGATAQRTGSQARDWWGRFLPDDAAAQLAATGERAADDIGRSLTDALLRGFESGEGFLDNLAETARNLFGSMVLKPIIQPLVRSAEGVVMGALGSLLPGSLLPGSALASDGAAQGATEMLGSSLLGGIGSTVTGFIGSSVGGIASALGASTGVATGLGAFAMSAVPVIGAIAALAGLFGGKPSGKYAHGSLDLGTGGVFDRGSQTGDKYSKENNEAVDALLTTTRGYADILRAMGGSLSGSHRFTVGDTYGYGLDVVKGQGGFKTEDQAAFIDHVFDTLIAEAEGLDASLKTLLSSFEGTAEEAVNFATAIGSIHAFTQSDLLGDALEQIRLAGRTVWGQWSDAGEAVRSTAAAFDGSLSSAQALGSATSARYQTELALVGQIQGLLASTSAMFGDSIRTIEMSILDSAGKYDFLRAEIDAAYASLGAAVDPQAIGDLASQINRLSMEAYGLLDADQKADVADEYTAYLEDVNRLTSDRLNASQAQVESQHNAMAAAIESAMQRVADTMMAAAQAQQAAASTPVTVNSRVTVDVNVDTPAAVEVGYGGYQG